MGWSAQSATADAPVRMEQVNAALREAGLPINEFSQRSFAAGIEAGHYRTYKHLVDAMKWHRERGKTIARFGVFGSFQDPPILLRAKGVVADIGGQRIELKSIESHGQVIGKKFHIQNDTLLEGKLRRGSTVSVEYLPGTVVASRIENLAPEGTEQFWGPVDCASCP